MSDEPAAIVPLIADPNNRRLLKEWLEDQSGYRAVEPGDGLIDLDFDLCILDEGAVAIHHEELIEVKQRNDPVLLPYLLLLPEDKRSFITGRGELADSFLVSAVDEVISMPIQQAELDWRIRSMCRLREQSLELHSRGTALRESEQRYRKLVDHFPDGFVALFDEDLRYTLAAPESLAVTGLMAEEIVGKRIQDLFPIHISDQLQPRYDAALAGDKQEFQVEFNDHIFDLTVVPIEGGSDTPEEGMVVAREITSRVERERRLESISESRSLALEAADAGIWEWDLETERVTWHDSCKRIFGVEDGEFDRTYEGFQARVHPDDRPEADNVIQRAVDRGQMFETRFRIIRDDGSIRWVTSRGRTLTDETGEPNRVLGVVVDITERQERLQQLRVLDRVLQHNLHNDMSVIRGYAETLTMEADDSGTNYAESIVEYCDKLLETVRKERDITEALSGTLDQIDFDLGRSATTVVRELEAGWPNAELRVDVEEDQVVVAPPEFELAIRELIDNAIRHNTSEKPTVEISVDSTSGTPSIRVADNGPGIPAMEQKVVTGERDIQPLYHGSGLGLWMIAWLVRRSGATLDFEENTPTGSVVSIEFPQRSVPRQTSPPPEMQNDD